MTAGERDPGLVVIVGGGPAGLAAAYRLSEDPTCNVLLLERANRLGGLAAGMERDGMRLDFGPHRLHPTADPEVLADLRALLGDELELRPRLGLIYLHGRYLPFPPTARTVAGLGLRTIVGVAIGLLRSRLAGQRPARSYAEAVISAVGRPLYGMFYGPYAEKVWGLPGEQLAVEQATRRVNQRGARDFLRMLAGRGSSRQFLYPRGGFGRIPAAYVDALRARSNVGLLCGARVRAVQIADSLVRGLEYEHEGDHCSVEPSHLVWTAPLAELTRLADACSASVRQSANRLRTRAVIVAYAEIGRPFVGRADTYYFPERHFPFNRVMEQKRFSAATVPADRTVLVMDLACESGDARFSASDDALLDVVAPALEEARLARRSEIVRFWSVRFRSAYPIYGLDTAASLRPVRDWTDGVDNLWVVGRQGLFLHNNTHHSLLMGYRAAAAIRSGSSRGDWLAEVATFADFTVAD